MRRDGALSAGVVPNRGAFPGRFDFEGLEEYLLSHRKDGNLPSSRFSWGLRNLPSSAL
jgi:hypothetical protein